ncbi:MAG: GTPase [Candidatus Woesearchaeota archaeon]
MSFWQMVNKVIRESDVLLLVLDSRLAYNTRNIEIEDKVQKAGKPLIYVLNKCDLVDMNVMKELKKKIPGSVFISARKHLGMTKLREKIMIKASQLKKSRVTVGVLGYPNVGKSSIINALKGKAAAKTSSISGYTRHTQKIKTSSMILLDTPGVIPYQEKNDIKHNLIGAIDYSREKDPDVIVMMLMNAFPGLIEGYYNVPVIADKEEAIQSIALKRKVIRKGNTVDALRMSRMILHDWQRGVIKSDK